LRAVKKIISVVRRYQPPGPVYKTAVTIGWPLKKEKDLPIVTPECIIIAGSYDVAGRASKVGVLEFKDRLITKFTGYFPKLIVVLGTMKTGRC